MGAVDKVLKVTELEEALVTPRLAKAALTEQLRRRSSLPNLLK